jgi:hypothetical protein
MQFGAFALLDCLGFKGVWARSGQLESILASLEQVKLTATTSPLTQLANDLLGENGNISLAFISDTVAVGVSVNSTTPLPQQERGHLLTIVGVVCALLIEKFGAITQPLNLRGCITTGAFEIRDTFILGPAVDEAAALAEQAEGAYIWLTPRATQDVQVHEREIPSTMKAQIAQASREDVLTRMEVTANVLLRLVPDEVADKARKFWQTKTKQEQLALAPSLLMILAESTQISETFLRNVSVPMKGGGSLRTNVVNPLAAVGNPLRGAFATRLIQQFNTQRLDVWIKEQNTRRLFEVAMAASMSYQEQVSTVFKKHMDEELFASLFIRPKPG